MAKNQFHPIANQLSKEEWDAFIPMNSYAMREVHELPDFIKNNGATQKFNSALTVASASTTQEFYGVIGYRPDKQNTEMDEHAWVYVRTIDTDQWQGGILDHANYFGRTTQLPQYITDTLNISGVTASIDLDREPNQKVGSLHDLQAENVLSGVSKNFFIVNNQLSK